MLHTTLMLYTICLEKMYIAAEAGISKGSPTREKWQYNEAF